MKVKSYFSSNLKFLRERKAQSQQELSTALNMGRSKLAAYEIGQTKNPPVDDLISFSEYFNIPVDVMLKVDVSRLSELKIKELESNKNVYTGKDMRVIVTTVDSKNKENIEYVPIKAKAGYLSGYADPEYISKLPVFNLPHLPKDKKYRMFPTEGDSMYPFPENAMIIGEFVENWFLIKNDTPCIVITKSEGIVFKLVTNNVEKGQMIHLKSLNPSFQAYDVPMEEVCEIWKYNSYVSNFVHTGEISTEQLWMMLNSIKDELKEVKKRA